MLDHPKTPITSLSEHFTRSSVPVTDWSYAARRHPHCILNWIESEQTRSDHRWKMGSETVTTIFFTVYRSDRSLSRRAPECRHTFQAQNENPTPTCSVLQQLEASSYSRSDDQKMDHDCTFRLDGAIEFAEDGYISVQFKQSSNAVCDMTRSSYPTSLHYAVLCASLSQSLFSNLQCLIVLLQP
ncbi:hypothetical protein BDN72DRAFT_261417 [Pluteus cervinus]|uniref:Uncharacterized protein n=1 Tax=Pluteus cervinus TaxID=181527 RepID=A0ACD3AG28_9AGAR|nr:hypothetical protein BDN72DRAFT_261417 [Pluteus cervinus]